KRDPRAMTLARKLVAGVVLVVPILWAASNASANESESLEGLRLFLTPEQRLRLNNRRDGIEPIIVPVIVEAPVVEEPPKPKPKPKPVVLPRVTFQGYVTRSDGETTVWVNNRPVGEGQQVRKNVRVLSVDEGAGKTRVSLPDNSTISLKPGQRFEPKNRRVVDSVK
ncbi:MAG: hypothetical protein AAF420_02350, partial [Pseudomonadota bacterium]